MFVWGYPISRLANHLSVNSWSHPSGLSPTATTEFLLGFRPQLLSAATPNLRIAALNYALGPGLACYEPTLPKGWARHEARHAGNLRLPLKKVSYIGSPYCNPQRHPEIWGEGGRTVQFPNSYYSHLRFAEEFLFKEIKVNAFLNIKIKYCLGRSTRQWVLRSRQQINHVTDPEAAPKLQILLLRESCQGLRICHWKSVLQWLEIYRPYDCCLNRKRMGEGKWYIMWGRENGTTPTSSFKFIMQRKKRALKYLLVRLLHFCSTWISYPGCMWNYLSTHMQEAEQPSSQ